LKNDGHEIGSHTVTHPDLTTLGSKKLKAELANSKAWLENNGLGPIYDFACPYGEYNNTTIAAIKQYYLSQRTGYDEGYNTAANFDPYKIKVQIVTNTTTMAEFSGWLAQAKAQGAWLVLEYHQVDNSGDEYGVTPANFELQAQAIQASGVKPVTVKQGLDAFALASN
jgi:peptidoglycan/xylan/chitin deacetylase (PgdA/CDA1 family)